MLVVITLLSQYPYLFIIQPSIPEEVLLLSLVANPPRRVSTQGCTTGNPQTSLFPVSTTSLKHVIARCCPPSLINGFTALSWLPFHRQQPKEPKWAREHLTCICNGSPYAVKVSNKRLPSLTGRAEATCGLSLTTVRVGSLLSANLSYFIASSKNVGIDSVHLTFM